MSANDPKRTLALWRQSALRALKTSCDHPPHYQHYDRAYDCADETSALASLVPADSLAEVGCYKSSNNPQQGCQNKPLGFVLIAGMKESGDHSRHKSNYDGQENAHLRAPSRSAVSVRLGQLIFNMIMVAIAARGFIGAIVGTTGH